MPSDRLRTTRSSRMSKKTSWSTLNNETAQSYPLLSQLQQPSNWVGHLRRNIKVVITPPAGVRGSDLLEEQMRFPTQQRHILNNTHSFPTGSSNKEEKRHNC